MLTEKVDIIIKALGLDVGSIANAAGFDRSIVSRIKSGARVPKRDSTSIAKFVRGVEICAENSGKTELLCKTIGCSSELLPEEIMDAMLDWLYDESGGDVIFEPISGNDGRAFGGKLSDIMEAVHVTNAVMSKSVNIDPSYLSRMRSGERVPADDSPVLMRICEVIARLITETDSSLRVAEVMEIRPEIAARADADMIAAWLTDKGVMTDTAPVRKLISSIGNIDTATFNIRALDRQAVKEFIGKPQTFYHGIDGMRRAAGRFLLDAAEPGSGELLLYSDQSMEWMEGEFFEHWLSLMGNVLSRGVRVRIIHTVERSSAELIKAIARWLPLYLSGLVEPYYCMRRIGDRFCFSMFIDPGRACVKGSCVRGYESICDYRYITDRGEIADKQREFEGLLKDCRPLVKISPVLVPPRPGIVQKTIGSVQMFIDNGIVRINKLTQPTMSFAFDHPMMVASFQSFI